MARAAEEVEQVAAVAHTECRDECGEGGRGGWGSGDSGLQPCGDSASDSGRFGGGDGTNVFWGATDRRQQRAYLPQAVLLGPPGRQVPHPWQHGMQPWEPLCSPVQSHRQAGAGNSGPNDTDSTGMTPRRTSLFTRQLLEESTPGSFCTALAMGSLWSLML